MMRKTGLAFELVGLILAGIALGYGCDYYLNTIGRSSQIGPVIGIIVAFILWIVHLIKELQQ